jgi:hypothetical protein
VALELSPLVAVEVAETKSVLVAANEISFQTSSCVVNLAAILEKFASEFAYQVDHMVQVTTAIKHSDICGYSKEENLFRFAQTQSSRPSVCCSTGDRMM